MSDPTPSELNKMHWKDRWEFESSKEYETLLKLDEKELLNRIENGKTGFYFNIWRAIGKNGTLKNSWEVLLNFLKNNPGDINMLNRYHCANALFLLMGTPDPASKSKLRKEVQWDHEGEEKRLEAITKLKKRILKLLEEKNKKHK